MTGRLADPESPYVPTVRTFGLVRARCDCGWTADRPDPVDAERVASEHRAYHETRR